MYPLIFDNKDFIVVAKPTGLSVHCDDGITGFTAILSEQLKIKLYLVHRLDRVTSGLMVFAKNAQVAAIFGRMFQERSVSKYYVAISDKKPIKKQGTVKGDMQKSRRMSWQLSKSKTNPAVTRFKSASLGKGMRLFLLKPETGKTHQLRVALKSLGAAILGDPIYYNKDNESVTNQVPVTRCYLHAWQLNFTFADQRYHFKCVPDEGELFGCCSVIDTLQQWSEPGELDWPIG